MSYPPPPGQDENESPDQQQGATPPPSPYGAPPPYGTPPNQYGAPQYGAPGYGAPGYGAPQYGAPGFNNPYGPTTQSNQKALWSMILGIVGLLCCGFASIAALIMGSQARKEIAASGGTQSGEGQAQAGFILGIVGCALWGVGVILYALVFASAGTISY